MIQEIRCSKLAIPMSCAGALFFTDLLPEDATEPARQGTAAAEMLEYLIAWGNAFPVGAADFSGVKMSDFPVAARNGYLFEDEMLFHLKPIVQEIFSERDGRVISEGEIFWLTAAGIKIRGHLDTAFMRKRVLYVDDLKYGWKVVEPKENWQLIGYAVGEIERMIQRGEPLPDSVVLRIHQPRPYHEDGITRTWELTLDQLWFYRNQIEQRCWAIAKQGEQQLVTGKHCRYCEAAHKCPAINRVLYSGIEHVMEFKQDDMSETAIAQELDLIARIEEVVKIRKESMRDLAIHKMRGGKIIPNYTMTHSYGDRKWKPGITAEAIKKLTDIDVIKHDMLSPAQAEKMGVKKEFVNALVDRHFIGMKLERADASKAANKVFGTEAPSAARK
ncbi:MAG: DUF2800 domain-containing protein [Afipia sp.]